MRRIRYYDRLRKVRGLLLVLRESDFLQYWDQIMMKIILILLILAAITFITGSKSHPKYKQSLTVLQTPITPTIKLQFNIPSKYLPGSLQTQISDNIGVRIRYGPYFQRYGMEGRSVGWNGITTWVYGIGRGRGKVQKANQLVKGQKELFIGEEIDIGQQLQIGQQIQPQLDPQIQPQLDPQIQPQLDPQLATQHLQLLQSIFKISLPPRYTLSLPNSLVIQDPNDKFCRHHMETLFFNFLPCGTYSGLAQLLDLDTFFSAGVGGEGGSMYGMEVVWTRDGDVDGMEIGVFVGGFGGLRRAKVGEKCMEDSELVMEDARGRSITVRDIVVHKLQQSLAQPQQNIPASCPDPQIYSTKHILGNWYNPHKILQILINATQVSNNSVIIVRELLPARAGIDVEGVGVRNFGEGTVGLEVDKECVKVGNWRERKYRASSVLCTIRVKNINKVFEKQTVHFLIRIEMFNKLICFDNYQTIFGGGTEIPSFPIALYDSSSPQPQQQQFFAGPASLKTPEPDQSLPFQVITFVLGIFGYLWLSVWRKLVSDMRKIKEQQQQEQEQQNQKQQ